VPARLAGWALPPVLQLRHTLVATNKSLARSNKSRTRAEATKKRRFGSIIGRGVVEKGKLGLLHMAAYLAALYFGGRLGWEFGSGYGTIHGVVGAILGAVVCSTLVGTVAIKLFGYKP
jgi:hypothetical protein